MSDLEFYCENEKIFLSLDSVCDKIGINIQYMYSSIESLLEEYIENKDYIKIIDGDIFLTESGIIKAISMEKKFYDWFTSFYD